jgi:5-methylcytosine-specific restriction protein A
MRTQQPTRNGEKRMAARGKPNGKYQGSKWLTRARRLGIYLRDGLACVYCGATVEDGTQLSLDHIIPYSEGGSTKSDNLVSCCKKCNDSRGNRDYREFADKVAGYLNHGISVQDIIDHIETTRHRPVDIKAAKALIAQRGSFTKAVYGA